MKALYRPDIGAPWVDCLLVARHPGGLVVREVGRILPGHFLATLDQVRVEGAGSFSPGAKRITRSPKTRGVYGEVVVPHSGGLAGLSNSVERGVVRRELAGDPAHNVTKPLECVALSHGSNHEAADVPNSRNLVTSAGNEDERRR
jgi:hypothetical protein